MSREEHTIAQTRELKYTTMSAITIIIILWLDFLYICLIGLQVVEVTHNIISGYITKTLKLVNSFDTWHGEHGYCVVYYTHNH